jgi:hypothetical protein
MSTITSQIDQNQQATLNGLIKANDWIFEQINKTIPDSLISLSNLNTGTDGAQIFVDRNVRISDKSSSEDLMLTTCVDIDREVLHVNLYRKDDFTDVDFRHMPALTHKVNEAFKKAGIIRH